VGPACGKYTVEICNEFGKDRAWASVTVQETPLPPVGKPNLLRAGATSVTVSWYGPSYDGGCVVTDYRLEMQNCTSNPGKWDIIHDSIKDTYYCCGDLPPGSKFVFRVSCSNKCGWSLPSNESDVMVTENQSTSSSSLHVNGSLNGGRLSTPTGQKPGLGAGGPRPGSMIEMYDNLGFPFEPRVVAARKTEKAEKEYDMKEEIGKGKFGRVHRAVHKTTGKVMAAKFLRCATKKKREAVYNEIDIMNCLHYHRLLLLADVFESTKEIIMVLEYIGGGELFLRIISEDFEFTEGDCIVFMGQICDAVAFMHKKQASPAVRQTMLTNNITNQ
jgi:hypothetical protein